MTIKRNLLFAFALAVSATQITHLSAENPPVLTWHNNNDRNGLNSAEIHLTPDNVNAEDFGKVGFFPTDGKVDAQPLYAPGIVVNGVAHNLLVVASERDTVYAFDAQSGKVIWKKSVLQPGETPSDNRACGAVNPVIGITATPVIDLKRGPHGAIYLIDASKDSAGRYHQRINALDLANGSQLVGGPVPIQASYPGSGDNTINGKVVFDTSKYFERAALLEWNGLIFTTWSSHCDSRPYTGWVIAYSANTLKQSAVLNLTPNGSEGAVWMAGAGPAATPTQIFLAEGNGTFDTELNSLGLPVHQNFGNSFVELATTDKGLGVRDYYATDTTVQQSNVDLDLGSGGVMLFPTIFDNAGNQHWLATAAGKDGNVYVVDRNDMGKYHSNGGSIYQVVSNALPNGEYATPAWFDNKVYYGGVGDTIKAFSFSNAKLSNTPVSRSPNTFTFPGATPSISSNGNSNGIVWAVNNNNSNSNASTTLPAVLYAYDAQDLSHELYNSSQAGTRDQLGPGNKFIVPTISYGHVYVGTQTGVAVYGLLGK